MLLLFLQNDSCRRKLIDQTTQTGRETHLDTEEPSREKLSSNDREKLSSGAVVRGCRENHSSGDEEGTERVSSS